ncbi:MAG: right-handed parallel beta-helix repeat-containing protein, partial [Planctomycetota bacterium]
MRIAITITALCALCAVVQATIINVPADYITIQAAIDRAVDGDTVLVAPGTYVENINFKGKGITVKSSSGAESTVINGMDPQDPDYGSVVFFMKWEQADSVLEGFSLMKGSGTYQDYWGFLDPYGGGIFCKASSPTILNNIITENKADFGGGISCLDGASPVIFNNTIVNNQVGPPAGLGGGGGIYCDSSSPMISNNLISENLAEAFGGGIFCWDNSSPMIIDNRICFNETDVGGGIYCGFSSPIILNNLIMGNIGLEWAGGTGFRHICFSLVFNNIISLNSAPMGGGVYIDDQCSPTFSNNSIIGNSAKKGGGVICSYNAHPVFTNTSLWENVASIEGPEIWVGNIYSGPGSSLTIDYS